MLISLKLDAQCPTKLKLKNVERLAASPASMHLLRLFESLDLDL